MNMKINRWIFLSLPDLPWVVWRPLSLDLAFVISQKLIFEVYQKFFLNKSWKSGWRQILMVKWKWDEKKLLTIFIAHILLVLFALLPKIISSVNDIRNKSYMNCGNKMKMKKWSSRWTQFMQLRKETWKNSGLQWGLNPWPCDTGVMLYQLSYDTTDVGSRSRYKICWRYMRLGDTSSWQSIFMGISQESILGLLSFNIVMNDLPCSITM